MDTERVRPPENARHEELLLGPPSEAQQRIRVMT